MLAIVTPHSPAATALIWSVSPPLGARAKLATRPACPLLGPGLAFVRDDRRQQRQVVGVRARARAELALELRTGQIGIAADLTGLDLELVVDDDARAGREGEPVVGAQVGRYAAFEDFDLTGANRPSSCACASRAASTVSSSVGWTAIAFVAQALEQFLLLPSIRLILMPVCLVKSP